MTWSLTELGPDSSGTPAHDAQQTHDTGTEGKKASDSVIQKHQVLEVPTEIAWVAKRIDGLKGPMDISQLEAIVQKLQELKQTEKESELFVQIKRVGEFMEKNIKGEKVEKHSKREWWQQMKAWLAT